jgi:hypothetical protein
VTPELWSGRSLTIDGQHCLILDPGLLAFPPILRRVRHRYVLLAHKRDAARFSQLREREGAICSYFELESGGWLCSWYHQTEFRAFNLYHSNKYRTIVVAEVISGTDFAGRIEGSTRSSRRFSGNYWGILRITHQWVKVRGSALMLVFAEACETARRMNG